MDARFFEEMEGRIPKGRVRTRFAPSPTGYMHVGNLRTALYAWLLARSQRGDFLLRIEDTDQERFVAGAIDAVYRTLKECGLDHDEGPDRGGPVGPYIQTERRALYHQYAGQLIEKGGAYRCFCNKERLESLTGTGRESGYDGHCRNLPSEEIDANIAAGVPFVVRQKIPQPGRTVFRDVIYGDISVDNADLDDQVLLKSDGLPTYNFANVVDDHLMGITHVVRGSEYLSSAPKYNLLYEGFGWDVPVYVHCAPVMRDAHNKMSKRHGDPSYEDLIAEGFLSPAIVNYVALLGWSPGGEREQFTLSELADAFHIKGISKSPAIFDREKLRYFNSLYIKALPPEAFLSAVDPYLRDAVKTPGVDLRYLAGLIQSRCDTLRDVYALTDFLDVLPEYDNVLYTHKKMKTDPTNALSSLQAALPVLEGIPDWTQEGVHDALIALAQTLEVKNGQIMWPVRVALSGKESTPGGAVELCVLLGKDESVRRIRHGIAQLS